MESPAGSRSTRVIVLALARARDISVQKRESFSAETEFLFIRTGVERPCIFFIEIVHQRNTLKKVEKSVQLGGSARLIFNDFFFNRITVGQYRIS